MISFSELKRGLIIVIEKEPYQIVETNHVFKGRGKSILQAKLRNLKTGNLLSRAIRPSESFEEAEVSKISLKFLYKNRGEYFFCKEGNPKDRFSFQEEILNPGVKFLKENEIVDGILFEDKVIDILPPIKVNLRVTEAAPGLKGDRAQSGTKVVVVETGVEIDAPLFIKEGDIIEINTETAEYVRRSPSFEQPDTELF